MHTVSNRSQQTSSLPAPALQPVQPSGPQQGSARSSSISPRPAAMPRDSFQAESPLARARAALGGEVLAVPTATAASIFASNDILQRYQPLGASAATARQDGLPPGVASSNRMADTDRSRLLAHKEKLAAAAQRYGVPPAVLAAIASRETRGGARLGSNGYGLDDPNGFGLMQVDKVHHSPAGGPYSQEHINQAASILRGNLDQVRAKHPSWPPEQQLRGAIAAYNFGVDDVQTIAGMDQGTTGNDYSNDVWARALHLSNDFGGRPGTPGTGPVITNPTPEPGTPTQAPSLLDVRTRPETFLRQGMEGEPVRQLQQLLGMPAAAQNGKFDATTRQAVINFQASKGLTPPPGKEGWVGATTLNELEKAAYPADPNTSYVPAPTLEQVRTQPETFLRRGMEGEPVRQLQQLLGLKDEALTGRFDARTDAAVRAFQASKGLTPPPGKEGWVGATTLSHLEQASGTQPAPAPGQWTPAPSLDQVRAGTAQLREGMQGEAVRHIQQRLGLPQDGKFGPQTKQAVFDFQRRNGLTPPPGLEGVVGKTTLEHLERTPSMGSVNPNHPILQKLATGSLINGADSTCVATTIENMDRLGVPNFPGGTAADPNNPRGAMVRMMREAGWVSVPLPGSQQRTIRSPAFGTVTAHVISADAYEKMALAGQIPSGALIFQTRHGWEYSGGSSGNDMGIVRNNGRVTHNYKAMSPIIYSDAKEVVLLVPRDALR